MLADAFLIGRVRLWQLPLLLCTMASWVTLAAEDTYNCIPVQGGSSPTDPLHFDQVGSSQWPVSPPSANSINTPSAAENFYIVQKGDTLYAIMRKSGVPIEKLIVLNQLPSDNNLKAGQSLRLPDITSITQPWKQPETNAIQPFISTREMASTPNAGFSEALVDRYVVRVGDTLYAISRKTGVSIERLASLNQLAASNRINAGQQLRLR